MGCARSGTTLVRTLLDSHPRLAIPGESYFVAWLAERRTEWEGADGFATGEFLDAVTTHPRFVEWGVGREAVAAEMARTGASTYADGIRAVFRSYAVTQGKPRYGDKTPGYVLSLPLLGELFPEAVFVHVVRDGRDAATSIRATSTSQVPMEALARFWRDSVVAGRTYGTSNPHRYVEIRYEDLVADAERELRRVCPVLGLDFDPAMLDHRASAERMQQMSPRPHLHSRLHLEPTRRLRDWTTEMRPADAATFELVAGGALRAFGYPAAPVPLRRRAANVAGATMRRARSRLRR